MQPETQIQSQTPSPVDFLSTGEEGLINLIKEVLENPEKYKEEAKLLLRLSIWFRQGGSYIDEAFYSILLGDVDEVEISSWDAGYPYECGEEIVLIPKVRPVVILYRVVEDYGQLEINDTLYIFTGRNWVSIQIQ